ncbi:unnamed protein product [Peronospora belbahrii]|uniref:Uncharacterized protein n=1 Tax=Peronospora belbahrii TaxID=622444 RepID=A0ABN8D1J4_9STRA|nr:unnamed protein product [Peronospora belbahrii]
MTMHRHRRNYPYLAKKRRKQYALSMHFATANLHINSPLKLRLTMNALGGDANADPHINSPLKRRLTMNALGGDANADPHIFFSTPLKRQLGYFRKCSVDVGSNPLRRPLVPALHHNGYLARAAFPL